MTSMTRALVDKAKTLQQLEKQKKWKLLLKDKSTFSKQKSKGEKANQLAPAAGFKIRQEWHNCRFE